MKLEFLSTLKEKPYKRENVLLKFVKNKLYCNFTFMELFWKDVISKNPTK